MRLLWQISRTYQNTNYDKYWIVIPNKLIKELDWDKGEELKAKVKGEKLIIEKD
ncbi:AbrB/MazE/SpoVT family DNA-binding domain-containing protein [Candidatus Woesearchaeota archaeon]|nr:AbrB/MazE/SpoVT family DNA-binding domain-containing protein [Candidatus Woesearchaeota archaeon]